MATHVQLHSALYFAEHFNMSHKARECPAGHAGRMNFFLMQQLTVSKLLKGCTQSSSETRQCCNICLKAVLGFGSTHNVHLVHYSLVLLPFHSDAGANEQHNGNKLHAAAKCRADSPAMADTGLGGGFEFIAAALPRHRDNSKQLSDAGVEACNGNTK